MRLLRRSAYQWAYRAGYRDGTRHMLIMAAGNAKDRGPLSAAECKEWLAEIERTWAEQDATRRHIT